MKRDYKIALILLSVFFILFTSNLVYGKYYFSEELEAYNLNIKNYEGWDISATENDNVIAYIDGDTLMIEGKGNMKNFSYDADLNVDTPWKDYNINSAKIAEGVLNVGDCAFFMLANINNVILPNTLKTIGNCSFSYCTSLTDISIPEGVVSIGELAFGGSGLENIIIPNTVTYIGEWGFWECVNLANVTLSNSLTSIGYGTFMDTNSLESVTIPEDSKLAIIGESAFSNCSIKDIIIPNSVITIGNSAFSNSGLEEIVIPDSVKTIEYEAFATSNNLKTVCIKGVENIAQNAFRDCNNLESVILPNTVKSIEQYAFWNCKNLRQVIGFENTKITSIESGTFEGSGLENIIIPNSVITIGNSAFSDSKLKNIVIPSSVKSIEQYAFWNCKNLNNIKIPNNVNSIGKMAFGETFVPSETKTIYCDFYERPNTWDEEWCVHFNVEWLTKTQSISNLTESLNIIENSNILRESVEKVKILTSKENKGIDEDKVLDAEGNQNEVNIYGISKGI